jgi:two-component system, OmpR family, sensor histidine kinase CpxA
VLSDELETPSDQTHGVPFRLPIRGLTRSIRQLTEATRHIAEGQFEIPLSIRRRDELGQLGESIHRMAERLSELVHGQKRFLGDVAHELCTPISRMQFALGILEQRAEPRQQAYVTDLQEELEHVSGLVDELLSFSKAQLTSQAAQLEPVNLAETVRKVLQREASDLASIEVLIDERIEVWARPDYLFRSVANLVRNAIRYAGDAGPITISAKRDGGNVWITVADRGPGLPDKELENVFKPFYRPEFARQRETGGVGLGLAIVRSCVEACGGAVNCRNRSPRGLEVEIRLLASPAAV